MTKKVIRQPVFALMLAVLLGIGGFTQVTRSATRSDSPPIASEQSERITS